MGLLVLIVAMLGYFPTWGGGPAVCEIAGCGVQAVRRCLSCRRAICLGHQALSSGPFGLPVYLDICTACLAQEQYERQAAWDRERRAEESQQGRILAGRDHLRAAGVQTVRVAVLRDEPIRTGWLGPKKRRFFWESEGDAWLLGNLPWRVFVSAYKEYQEVPLLTALLAHPVVRVGSSPHTLWARLGLRRVSYSTDKKLNPRGKKEPQRGYSDDTESADEPVSLDAFADRVDRLSLTN